MLPYILAVLCFAATCQGNDEDKELKWPDTYSLEAVRISLTSGVIEDYKIWVNKLSSRIDYNKGTVKSIITTSDDYEYGVKYVIHPESTDGQNNVITCYESNGTIYDQINPETILPSIVSNKFEFLEYDPIHDQDTVRFFYKENYEEKDTRHTLWAKYEDQQKAWMPVRYESIQYNSWLGSLGEHVIWDFSNFNYDIDDSVFDTNMYNCSEKTEEVTSVLKPSSVIDMKKKEHVDHVFNVFKTKFNRKYTHKKEHALRRTIFKKNLRLILTTNRKNLGYKLSINKFADRTPDEMKKYQGLQRRPEGKVGNIPFPYTESKIKEIVTELPAEYDLRILGYISTIKDQEDCGSCWTFGTTSAVEGALARINDGRLKSLSNQALIDCAWPFGSSGCDGGSDNAAYEWMMKYGLPTEAEYGPYLNKEGFCRIKNMTQLYPIRGFTDVTPYSIGALKVAIINHGPLSVSVDATDFFRFYSGGIFYDTTCDPVNLNHELTLVGYGERDGETFWILKNSWGPTWGVDGYMLISSRDNNCGIATEPTYVVF